MNTNNIIKKALVYFFAILILYLGISYFFNSIPKSMTVEVTMRQSIDNNIQIFYKQNPYDVRDFNVQQRLNSSEDFNTVKFKIDENESYIYSLDLRLNNMGQETSNVEIKKITVKTLFSNRTLDFYSGFNNSYEYDEHDRFTIVDGFVFSPFELTTKIKIISLFISILIVFLCRKFISQICYNDKLNNDKFRIAIFTGSLFYIFLLNSVSLYKNYDYLASTNLSEKPNLLSCSNILDNSFMTSIERYSKEQFLYNNALIEDYYAFNKLLTKNQFDNNYITKFNNTDLILEESKFNNNTLDRDIKSIIALNEFLSQNDIPHIVFLAPANELYHDDKFPSYMNNQSAEIQEYFVDNLSKSNVKTYPISDYIYSETIEKDIESHFRTDPHWTVETSLIGYKYILDKLVENNIEVVINNDSQFELQTYPTIFSGYYGRKVAYGYRYNQVKDDFSIIYPTDLGNYTIEGFLTILL